MVTSAVLEATRIIFHVFCHQSLIKLIHRKSIFFGLLIRIPFVLQAIIVVEEALFVSFFNKLVWLLVGAIIQTDVVPAHVEKWCIKYNGRLGLDEVVFNLPFCIFVLHRIDFGRRCWEMMIPRGCNQVALAIMVTIVLSCCRVVVFGGLWMTWMEERCSWDVNERLDDLNFLPPQKRRAWPTQRCFVLFRERVVVIK